MRLHDLLVSHARGSRRTSTRRPVPTWRAGSPSSTPRRGPGRRRRRSRARHPGVRARPRRAAPALWRHSPLLRGAQVVPVGAGSRGSRKASGVPWQWRAILSNDLPESPWQTKCSSDRWSHSPVQVTRRSVSGITESSCRLTDEPVVHITDANSYPWTGACRRPEEELAQLRTPPAVPRAP